MSIKNFTLSLTLTIIISALNLNPLVAQTGILNPDDPIVIYNPSAPPATPAYGTLAKWVKTTRVSFVTTSFKSYYYKGMVFRLKFPKSYKDSLGTGKKYPMMIFFHGKGEGGTIYDNEYQLYNGGQKFMTAVDAGTFDGFLFYPQSSSASKTFNGTHSQLINELINNYFVPQIKVDINRIVVNGLSGGGAATWGMMRDFPKLVAAATPISAAAVADGDGGNVTSNKYTPIWMFSGGLDNAPSPFTANGVYTAFKNAGSNIKYTLYPTLGHGCWNNAWAEADYFPFLNRAYKSNPWALNGRTEYCPGDPISQVLGLTSGFDGYEWRKDGELISGANTNTYTATSIGSYDARIKRGTEWSDWSRIPVVIKLKGVTVSPDIQVTGNVSNVIPSPDGKTSVTMQVPTGYATYSWQLDGATGVLSTTNTLTVSAAGNYRVKVTEQYGCSSEFSNPFTVINSAGANGPSAASGVQATAISKNQIKLTWSQNPSPAFEETGFEIYRSDVAGGPYELLTTTVANAITYTDNDLNSNSSYYYKLRAINGNGASSVTEPVTAKTQADLTAPTTPGNLTFTSSTRNSVTLVWGESTDDVLVTKYDIYVNGVKYYESDENQYTIYNLEHGPTYTFKVKARDFAGNTSAFSNQVTAVAQQNGLTYKYYTYSGTWTALPNLSAMAFDASGVVPNITIANRSQDDNFAYLWEGYIYIPVSGVYYFRTTSDAGSRLWLGALNQKTSAYSFTGTPLVNNDGLHTARTITSVADTLQAGYYPIAIAFYEETGVESMTMSWRTPSTGTSYVAIPNTAFLDSVIVNGTVPATPTQLTATAVAHNKIKLTWKDNSSDETGFELGRSATKFGDYNFIGAVGANDTTFCDSTNLNASTTYYYKIRATGQYGESPLVGNFLEANWKFDNNLKDSGDSSRILTQTGGPTFDGASKAEGSHAIKLNGTTQSLLINTADGYLKNTYSEKTVAFWMKSASNTGARVIVDLGGNDDGLALRLDSSRLYYGIASNNVRKSLYVPYTSLEWNHVAMVYGNKTLRLYLNGVEVSVIPDLTFTGTTTTTNGSRIGLTESSNAFNAGSARFSGSLDNFSIYTTALTPDMIVAHMNNTAGISAAKTLALPVPPPAPTALTATGTGTNSAKVQWSFNPTTSNTSTTPGDSIRIEAESYSGMLGVATETCSEGGLDVKSIDANDWMDYTGTLKGGVYTVKFRVSTNAVNTGQFQLRTSDETVLATFTIAKTATTQIFNTYTATVTLPAGEQTLRVYSIKNAWTFNWFELVSGASTNTTTTTANASAIKLLRAETTPANYIELATLPADSTSYTDSSLISNGVYYYKVQAVNQGGSSAYSNEDSAATGNHAPVLTAIADHLMRYGTQLQLNVQAADVDPETLTVQALNLPSFATFTPGVNGGVLAFNPSVVANVGVYDSIKLVVNDQHNGSHMVSFKLVVDENYQPVIVPGVDSIALNEKQTAELSFAATDENAADSLVWSFTGLPSFATPVINGDSVKILIAPGYADNGVYHITAKVEDGNTGVNTHSFTIKVQDVNPNKVIALSFTDGTYMAAAPWNNTGKVPAINDDFINLKDTTGANTTVGVKLLTAWTGANNAGSNTGVNSGVYPDAVLRSSYYTGGSRTISIHGLTAGGKYNFTFLGSRANPTVGVVGSYSIGGQTVTLDAANNVLNTASINNVQPDADGSLVLTVANAAGSTYGYLNSLVIKSVYNDSTAPAQPRSLAAEMFNGKVRLTWIDAAYNDTAYEVYRSGTKAGPYTLLNPGGNNADLQLYDDAGIAGHTTYYYTVRALNQIGSSPYSDSISILTPNASPVLAAIANVSLSTQQTANVTVTATDEPGDIIALTATGLPAFATFTDNGNGTGVVHVVPNGTSGQFDNITITATDNGNASTNKQFSITVINTSITSTYINFNQTNPASTPWNNMNVAPTANATIANLKDEANNSTGMSVTLQDAWTAQTATGYTTGNNTGLYPDNVMLTSYYYNSSTVSRNILLSGLSTTKKYNLIFFASRNNNASSLVTRYTVGTQSVDLQVANNISTTVSLSDLIPDATGKILINVKAAVGPNAYIGALIVQAYTPDLSNPVAPANLTAAGYSKTQVRLNWQSTSNNGYEVWRSASATGTYTKLADVATNTNTYMDNGLTAATTYYYKVKTIVNGNASGFSNYAGASTIVYNINLNLNDGSANAPAQPGNWNNTNALMADGYQLPNMINDEGFNTGIAFNVVTSFSGFNYTGATTGNNSGVYPDNVMKNFYYVNYADTARLKITGLTLAHVYNFVFFGSRANPLAGVTAAYKIGNQIVTLDAANNTQNVVKLTGIKPDADGSVSITIYGTISGGFGYLNAMGIEGAPAVSPDPALGGGSGSAARVAALGTETTVIAQAAATPLSIYPNPFVDDVTLKLTLSENTSKFTILVADISGRIIHRKEVVNAKKGVWTDKLGLNGRSLQSGIYFIKVLGLPANSTGGTKIIRQ